MKILEQNNVSDDGEVGRLLDRVQNIEREVFLLKSQHQNSVSNLDYTSTKLICRETDQLTFFKLLYKIRQTRKLARLPAEIFGEPAWDILIDLYINEEEKREVSISSACIASNCPSTTALRWISVLESEHLVVRVCDPKDARRYFLQLTLYSKELLYQYYSRCVSILLS